MIYNDVQRKVERILVCICISGLESLCMCVFEVLDYIRLNIVVFKSNRAALNSCHRAL